MAGLGVASFGHVNGVHIQNKDTWETYSDAIDRGELPLARAYRPTDDERMRRELVLQLQLRRGSPPYFEGKNKGGNIPQFADQFPALPGEGYLTHADAAPGGLSRARGVRV